MATQNLYAGDGTANQVFNLTFEYLDDTDIKVEVKDTTSDAVATEITKDATNGWELINPTTIRLKGTLQPTSTDNVRIYRATDISTKAVTFAAGSAIRAQDLNKATDQVIFSVEEWRDQRIPRYNAVMDDDLSMGNHQITGLKDGDDDDDAVNRGQLAKVITDDLIAGDAITLTDAVGGTNSGDTTTVSVSDLGITTAKIANDAVNGDKIADDAIDSEHYAAGSIDDEHLAAGISGSKLSNDSVDLDKLSNTDVVESADYSTAWVGDDTKIATVGALEARHDLVVNTDVNPPSSTQTGKQWLSIAPGNQVHKIFDGSGWRTVAVGQPFSPATTTVVRYVDTTNGSDASDVTGFLPQAPLQSIGRALELINASSSGDGSLIKVAPGVYQETLPLRIKKNNISIVGESMRSCFVHPTVATENNDMFEVDSGSYIANLTLLGLKVPTADQGSRNNTLDNDATHGLPSNQPFSIRFRTDVQPVILKSPYVQNCTHFSDAHFDNANFDPNTFPSTDGQTFSAVAGDQSSAPCGGGLLIDGSAVSSSSPIRSMVVDAFTQICLDGPGILVTNNGYAQLVSFFGTFCHYHAKAKNGGQINLSNCVSDFGRFGLIADGKSPSAIATATANAANSGATTITVGAITTAGSFHGTVTQPLDHMMVTIDGVDYGVVSSTANGSGWDIVLTTGLTSNITNTTVSFALRSYISTGGHTFEFVGVGTDYGDHPDNGGVPVEANQVIEKNGGKVWQSSTDHVGKFKAGDVLVVDQVAETVALKDTTVTGDLAVTGTVDGRDVATDGNTLDALNTNAVLDTDTTTAAMQFVVDEDNMASNLDTKVPTQQSVKAYVDTEIADLVASAPATLDTLNELAAALGDDANFSTTVTNSIATKLDASGGTMAGDIAMGSNKITGLGAPSAAGDATTKQYVDAQISASGSGTVTNVSGTSPISVTNGTSTPAISISAATTSAAGTMSSTDKTKLDGIATGAEVNVQSDWNATSGDAFIANKPTIPSGNVVSDTAPELGGDLDAKGNTIIDTSATNANIKLRPNGTGAVEVRGDGTSSGEVGKLKLNCSTNGHGVILASPPHSAGASYTLTLPPDAGSNNQVLKTDGSGTTSWVDQTTAYTDSSVDSHLNQSTAGNGEVLSWNTSTSDYEWVAQSGGGGGSTSPGGSNTQVQFNNSGSFGGSANLTFDGTNLTVGGTITAISPTTGGGGHRKIHTSTSSPTSSDGADGDIWIKYT